MPDTPTPCGHWDGVRYCRTEMGVRLFQQGRRCPRHYPGTLAGRVQAADRPGEYLPQPA